MRLTITKQIGLLLILPALGALAVLGIFYQFFAQTVHDGPFINLAGRQRMLSEQLGAYVTIVSIGQEEDRGPLREFVSLFGLGVEVLEGGGLVMDRQLPTAPSEVQDEIADMKRLWETVRPSLLLVADRPADGPKAREAYALVASTIPSLTDASDRVVVAFEEQGRASWRPSTRPAGISARS